MRTSRWMPLRGHISWDATPYSCVTWDATAKRMGYHPFIV